MARNRKSYSKRRQERKNERQQCRQLLKAESTHALMEMAAYGQSKRADKLADKEALRNGNESALTRGKIYSISTMDNYLHITAIFRDYVSSAHPFCKDLSEARLYADEWLLTKTNCSGHTQAAYRSALAKLFQCDSSEFCKAARKRKRTDFIRSRGDAARDRNFNESLHPELVSFCKCTGLRRCEIESLMGGCVYRHEDGDYYIHIRNKTTSEHEKTAHAKGGRDRDILIIGTPEQVAAVVDKINGTPANELVWGKINTNADIHGYRHIYADNVYLRYQRSYEECLHDATFYNPEHNNGKGIPKGGYDANALFLFRGDRAGQWLDKRAMLKASQMLGHNRISVSAEFYISVENYIK